MLGPSNKQIEGKDSTDEGNEKQGLYSLLHKLQDEISQIRDSNGVLFRATANEMEILRSENSNLTNILLKLKTDFDTMVVKFLEQKERIRELETWKIFMENSHISMDSRDLDNDEEGIIYEEIHEEQDESDGNGNKHIDEEKDYEQKENSLDKEDDNYVAVSSEELDNETHESTEYIESSTEVESVKEEPSIENDSNVDGSALNDSTLIDSTKEDLEKTDSTKEDSEEIDSKQEDTMEIDMSNKDLIVQGLAMEKKSTDKELANKELVVKEPKDEESSDTDSNKIDSKKDEPMEIDLSQKNFTVKDSQTDERESTSNEPTQTNSAETDLKKESTMEIDFAQKDNSLNDSVEERESTDKKLADANLTKADSNKEDFMEINSTQESITVNVSVEESESTGTKDEKTADKESVNDGLTDLYSNKKDPIELCVKKDETAGRILAEEDCELEKDSETKKDSEAEKPTEVSMKEYLGETAMMKEPTEINSAEKEFTREEGSTVDDMVNGEPTEENDESNGSQQDSVKDQIASTSISKPKRKYYKNPIVLIKSKKRRLSSNSL